MDLIPKSREVRIGWFIGNPRDQSLGSELWTGWAIVKRNPKSWDFCCCLLVYLSWVRMDNSGFNLSILRTNGEKKCHNVNLFEYKSFDYKSIFLIFQIWLYLTYECIWRQAGLKWIILANPPDVGRAKCNERARYTVVRRPDWCVAKCSPATQKESAAWCDWKEQVAQDYFSLQFLSERVLLILESDCCWRRSLV